ncbi:MAG TPA: transketolase [Ktedonobacteraceae bacterium]|nr:transketolase [Ktedonobacteraceae bacterium]
MTTQEKSSITPEKLEELSINTIRTLAMDGVQKANSGHPGTAMALAPLAYLLWTRHMHYNPCNTQWRNRDRFILSAGHASMLLYSMLHLTGYELSLDDLKNFRQWGSLTPGHPEYRHTVGVETTTGPLGQGFGTGVGMAIAERILESRFNKPDHAIVDHYTYAIASDGDMMEGISSEAASIAGHLKLGKLIYFYDNNHITIEGNTDLAFSEDVGMRFEAYHWHVQHVEDANDLTALNTAIDAAKAETEKPSLIIVRSHIAFGSPNKHDTAGAHGSPLGEEEIKLTKENLGWPTQEPFFVPEEVKEFYAQAITRGEEADRQWQKQFAAYKAAYPELAAEWENEQNGVLPEGWDKTIPTFTESDSLATRIASSKVINAIAPNLPALVGGSADLAPSTNTHMNDLGDLEPTSNGRNLHFGIREHAMGAILNGISLHGGLIPFGATFLIFSDYMRPSIRLAALMNIKTIYVYTHDSIGLGEDGPTHQPVEQLAALRAIPNLTVLRPGDANETAEAWKIAITHHGPVAMALTRQNLPTQPRNATNAASNVAKGAYILSDSPETPKLILIATGSELALAVDSAAKLRQDGVPTRVVSMPSWELFEEQSAEYKESVLPKSVTARVAIEAASPMGWEHYVGNTGNTVTLNHFGASAPAKTLFQQFGFTVENVVAKAKAQL